MTTSGVPHLPARSFHVDNVNRTDIQPRSRDRAPTAASSTIGGSARLAAAQLAIEHETDALGDVARLLLPRRLRRATHRPFGSTGSRGGTVTADAAMVSGAREDLAAPRVLVPATRYHRTGHGRHLLHGPRVVRPHRRCDGGSRRCGRQTTRAARCRADDQRETSQTGRLSVSRCVTLPDCDLDDAPRGIRPAAAVGVLSCQSHHDGARSTRRGCSTPSASSSRCLRDGRPFSRAAREPGVHRTRDPGPSRGPPCASGTPPTARMLSTRRCSRRGSSRARPAADQRLHGHHQRARCLSDPARTTRAGTATPPPERATHDRPPHHQHTITSVVRLRGSSPQDRSTAPASCSGSHRTRTSPTCASPSPPATASRRLPVRPAARPGQPRGRAAVHRAGNQSVTGDKPTLE